MKMLRLFVLIAVLALFTMHVSQIEAQSTGSDTKDQGFSFPSNTENLGLDDLDPLIDQFLIMRQQGHADTRFFANDLLLFIFQHREDDKNKVSIILLRMYQNNDAESSESISQMLNEIFYFEPQIVVSALAEIENHLLEEYRNTIFIDYLINSACWIPQIITEDGAFNEDALRIDAKRIISEIRALDVNSALSNKVINIVEAWM